MHIKLQTITFYYEQTTGTTLNIRLSLYTLLQAVFCAEITCPRNVITPAAFKKVISSSFITEGNHYKREICKPLRKDN